LTPPRNNTHEEKRKHNLTEEEALNGVAAEAGTGPTKHAGSGHCREALLSGKTLRLGPYTVSTPTDSPVLAEKDF
jgi:hypothetical protein